jgi:hypothetical protein
VNRIELGFPCAFSACDWAIISSQVFGGCGVILSSYQSSCTLVFFGAAYSLPFQVAVSSGPGSASAEASALFEPVHSSIQPASANSATQVTSRPRMSSASSPAAIRRTICSRCPSAPRGSLL